MTTNDDRSNLEYASGIGRDGSVEWRASRVILRHSVRACIQQLPGCIGPRKPGSQVQRGLTCSQPEQHLSY